MDCRPKRLRSPSHLPWDGVNYDDQTVLTPPWANLNETTGGVGPGWVGDGEGSFAGGIAGPVNMVYRGSPVPDYQPWALLDALPMYWKTRHSFHNQQFESLHRIIASGEYGWFTRAIPEDEDEAIIPWRETYRSQASVPGGSFLLMIQANAFTGEEFATRTTFRLQIFDDGCGEYCYDQPPNSDILTGRWSNPVVRGDGPYILPAPLAVSPTGLMTVEMTNIETTGVGKSTSGTEGAIKGYLVLIFGVPFKSLEVDLDS